MKRQRALLIAGPTASGKSALALRLAEALASRGGAAIVNADSMQIYRELPILTARPGVADLARAPHHLYGFRAADEPCSAGEWAAMAAARMQEICNEGRLPILVGGTGLYFRALTEGIAPIPEIDPAIRALARQEMAETGPESFHARLSKVDPEMARRLRPSDPQRLLRAWEVLKSTGISLAGWQEKPVPPLFSGQMLHFALMPRREELYARCDDRLEDMLRAGVMREIAAFEELAQARKLDPSLPLFRAVGLAPLRGLLYGRLQPDEALQQAKTATRQYAKRQLTWIRNQMIAWSKANTKDSERLFQEIFALIIKSGLTDLA
ncbi:MAG: tRNA (adenosine(37)-N6)-dimethylallyltransferase MiaA [Alphaproteobacteria bacterium]|nr:tRNA (adenosine(37)-N6)-dimethylallyltransferase MiaA [Alphaproteobacteria bacterium]